jgi:hypothetical protein
LRSRTTQLLNHPLPPADPTLYPFDQCGGAGGNCKGAACADAAFAGKYCPAGYTCQRKDRWYWQVGGALAWPPHWLLGACVVLGALRCPVLMAAAADR